MIAGLAPFQGTLPYEGGSSSLDVYLVSCCGSGSHDFDMTTDNLLILAYMTEPETPTVDDTTTAAATGTGACPPSLCRRRAYGMRAHFIVEGELTVV